MESLYVCTLHSYGYHLDILESVCTNFFVSRVFSGLSRHLEYFLIEGLTKGSKLQGWGCERVALRLSSKGDRVIYVLPGDPARHLYKVREVVRVMEQEMGLAPGWLWQQHCKVIAFGIIISLCSRQRSYKSMRPRLSLCASSPVMQYCIYLCRGCLCIQIDRFFCQ